MINWKQYTNVAAVFAALSFASQLQAQDFGIKFLGNTTDNVTGSAGVVAMTGWNNIANTTFTTGTVLANDGLTAATLTLSGTQGGWHSGGTTADGGNGSLMDGYMDLTHGNTETITLSGLTGSLYNVYIYIYGDSAHPVNNGEFLPNYAVNGATNYAPSLGNGTVTYDATSTTVGGPFSGFVQATTYSTNFNTATANASDFGNYILVANVAPTNGVISLIGEADAQTWRSPLNGFEIVPTPEPSVMALSVAGVALFGLIRRRRV